MDAVVFNLLYVQRTVYKCPLELVHNRMERRPSILWCMPLNTDSPYNEQEFAKR